MGFLCVTALAVLELALQADLKLRDPPASECWDQRHAPPLPGLNIFYTLIHHPNKRPVTELELEKQLTLYPLI